MKSFSISMKVFENYVLANLTLSSSVKIMSGSVQMTNTNDTKYKKSKVLCIVHKLYTLIPVIKDRVVTK